ncbi:hypothetical protein [Alkalitalea saponilacus]|uniref:Uncharacterized protein n=1 Tax=Alkalitalea saponilacus TaxID=889453 RepID=A0A1T5HFG5_9BACT|nr:hypothetical protein [Alkalitalea saponilacus]ASB48093.1 hypothetical protein CDL62_02520 [Alkalitalea saponilacus]SKC19437.1 hypothetical protein SAMN03080601_02270 [Alkalitalea saponilacus]
MEKEALLKIILQDIKELETLLNTFSGKEDVPAVYIQLTKSKTQGILDEIALFEGLNAPQKIDLPKTPQPAPVKEEPKPTKEENPVLEIINEPAEEVKTTPSPEPEIQHKEKPSPPAPTPEKTKSPELSPKPAEPSKQETAKVTQKNEPSTQGTVLGEILGKDKQSFNEKLGTGHDSGTLPKFQQPIVDLRKAIGINDRFFFQRELFGNNSELFNQTIDQINQMATFESAVSFLSGNFNWDQNNEAVVSFRELIKRRFPK